MNGEFISERDHAQEAATELGNSCPEAEAIVLLSLAAHRVLDDANAHLFAEVRSAQRNVGFKVLRELKIRHAEQRIRFPLAG